MEIVGLSETNTVVPMSQVLIISCSEHNAFCLVSCCTVATFRNLGVGASCDYSPANLC